MRIVPGAGIVTSLRSSISIRAMQIRLFLEYHQNSNICRDIVFRKPLDTGGQRRNRPHLRSGIIGILIGGTLGRGSRLLNNGHRRARCRSIIWSGLSQSSVGGLRGKRFILPQKLFNLVAGDAGAKQVSLHFITFERPQKRGLLMGFHSLGDHLQV